MASQFKHPPPPPKRSCVTCEDCMARQRPVYRQQARGRRVDCKEETPWLFVKPLHAQHNLEKCLHRRALARHWLNGASLASMASEQIRLSYKASLSCCKRGHDSHGVSALLPAPRPAQRQCRRVFLKFRAETTALPATGYGAQLLWPSSGSRLSLPAQKHETQATHLLMETLHGGQSRKTAPRLWRHCPFSQVFCQHLA